VHSSCCGIAARTAVELQLERHDSEEGSKDRRSRNGKVIPTSTKSTANHRAIRRSIYACPSICHERIYKQRIVSPAYLMVYKLPLALRSQHRMLRDFEFALHCVKWVDVDFFLKQDMISIWQECFPGEMWSRRITQYDSATMVVYATFGDTDNIILGQLVMERLDTPTPWIAALAVRPEHRARGLGRQLLGAAMQEYNRSVKENPDAIHDCLYLTVDRRGPFEHRLVAYYETMGFQEQEWGHCRNSIGWDENVERVLIYYSGEY
jgi:GNAT superfamily N-acetyltransferase